MNIFKVLSIAVFVTCAATSVTLRLSNLPEWPGFEHDEALILLGADRIIGGHLPLTGDKVYEGPLLEYVLAGSFLAVGRSVAVARGVLALSGILSCVLLGLIAAHGLGTFAGITAGLLLSCSPWGFMAGRVIYACNLVPVFTLGSLFVLQKRPNARWAWLLSGFLTGCAMHGHLYACLIYPALLAASSHRWPSKRWAGQALLLAAGMACGFAPVLCYNCLNGFPAFAIFTGTESHATALTQGWASAVWSRWIGYAWTIWTAVRGNGAWLDFWESGFRASVLLTPAMALAGIALLAFSTKVRPRFRRAVLLWLTVAVVIVPLITKHRLNQTVWVWGNPSLPHYLDLVMPLLLLAAAVPIFVILQAANRQPRYQWLAIALTIVLLAENLMYTNGRIRRAFAEDRPLGRWTPGILALSNKIGHLDVPVVFASLVFGGGFPQLSFLHRDKRVVPVLGAPNGVHDGAGVPVPTRVVFVTPAHFPPPLLLGLNPEFFAPAGRPQWYGYHYQTDFIELVAVRADRWESDVERLLIRWDKGQGRAQCQWTDQLPPLELRLVRRIDTLSPVPQKSGRQRAVSPRHQNASLTKISLLSGFKFESDNEPGGEIAIELKDDHTAFCQVNAEGGARVGTLQLSRFVVR